LEEIGPALCYPTEIPRAIGIALSRRLKASPHLAGVLSAELASKPERSAADELEILRRYAEESEAEDVREPVTSLIGKSRAKPKTKTTFHIRSGAGQVKCTAGPGRLEILVDRDFSLIDRARLEMAVASLIDGLA
jgi:ParB family chromosome partitioning protein